MNVYPTEQSAVLEKGSVPTLGMGQVRTVDDSTFGSFDPKPDSKYRHYRPSRVAHVGESLGRTHRSRNGPFCVDAHAWPRIIYYDGLTLDARHCNWFNTDALGVIRGRYPNPVLADRFGEKACIRSQLSPLEADPLQLGASLDTPAFPKLAVRSADSPPPTLRARYLTLIGEIGTLVDIDNKVSYDALAPDMVTMAPENEPWTRACLLQMACLFRVDVLRG
ncbi:hypothetical protein ID866_8904 [Astraeus odoratus]|nr:hypothetical protein ID866_8904 [Astraeus odoratus]